jgi:hypothetical protein
MMTYGEVHVQIHVFLTSALVGGASRPCYFTPGESCTHWIGGLLVPITGLGDMEKLKFLTLPVLELQPLGLAALIATVMRKLWTAPGIRTEKHASTSPKLYL